MTSNRILRAMGIGRHNVSYWREYMNNLSVEIVLNGFGFLSGLLLARWLGPTMRGQLAAAMLWPNVTAILVTLGLQQAFAYAVGVGWGDPKHLHRIALKYSLLVGGAAMILYWFICPWLLSRQFSNDVSNARVFALYIPTAIYGGFLFSIHQGSGEFRRWNIARLFRSGAWTLSVAALALVAGLNVFNLLVIQVAIIVLVGFYLFSGIGTLQKRQSVEDKVALKPIFKYAIAVYASGLAFTVNQQLDQLLLSLWVVPSDLGQYAAAVTLSSITLVIPTAIGAIGFSKIAGAVASPTEQRLHIKLTLLWGVFLLIPLGFLFGIGAPAITTLLFGSEYKQAGELLRILAPAATLLSLGMLVAEVLRGIGKPVYATYGAILAATITIAGLALTLRRYGVWGAAWVSFTAYGSFASTQLLLLWHSITGTTTFEGRAPVIPTP